jgi:hypothetical protein
MVGLQVLVLAIWVRILVPEQTNSVKATELHPLFYGGKKKTWQMPGFLFLVKIKKSIENMGVKKVRVPVRLNLLKF